MKIGITLLFICLVSCREYDVKPYSGQSNILRNWDGRGENPSFAGLAINRYENSANYLICDGDYPTDGNLNSFNQFNETNNYQNTNGSEIYNNQIKYKKIKANKTSVTNVMKGQMILRSNSINKGSITFGTLAYVGSSNYNCQLLSDQALDYEVLGNRLLVCFKDPNQNICIDYNEHY